VHQRLYEAILKLVERGQIAGPATLKNYFEQDSDLAHVGGAEYLADLAASVITIINAEDYGRTTINDLYMRRELIALCQEVLDALCQAAESAQLAFNHDGGVTSVTTEIRSLNRRLGSLQPLDLIILAGRPSMVKTALAANIGVNAAGAMRRHKEGKGLRSGSSRWRCQASSWASVFSPNRAGFQAMRCTKGRSKQRDFHRFAEISQQRTDLRSVDRRDLPRARRVKR
jgi:replicative DNA helicase